MLIKITMILITLFGMIGCGFMYDETRRGGNEPQVSDEIKSFSVGVSKDEKVRPSFNQDFSNGKESDSKYKIRQHEKIVVEACEGGGTVTYVMNFDINEEMNRSFLIDIVAENCIDDGLSGTYHGSIEFKIKSDDLNLITFIFKEESTFENLETGVVATIYKGSKMIFDELSFSEELITESVKYSTTDGERYESMDLVAHENFYDNYLSSSTLSGVLIYGGVRYRVDEEYDTEKTPMLYVYEEESESLMGGTVKYYNEKHEHITIKVVQKDKIKISVDINNDGKDDAVEILDIKNFTSKRNAYESSDEENISVKIPN